jgi:fused signal recognition particle receptor
LHTKVNLMEELKKVVRVIKKVMPDAPHYTLLVLDGTTGQNALNQAKQFIDTVGVDGIALTKLDGSAKGGAVIGIAHELKLPVAYIGVGEGIDDLQRFDPHAYAESLIGQ